MGQGGGAQHGEVAGIGEHGAVEARVVAVDRRGRAPPDVADRRQGLGIEPAQAFHRAQLDRAR